MDPITARYELEQARAHLEEAEENLARATAAATGILQDAASHARYDVDFTRKRVDAMLAQVRSSRVRVRVDPATRASART